MKLWQEALASQPTEPSYQTGLASSLIRLAGFHREQGSLDEAVADCRKAVELWREALASRPTDITRLDTGRSVVVTVNDRGPFGKRRRIFDLSKAAARELDMLKVGKAEIRAVVLLSENDIR